MSVRIIHPGVQSSLQDLGRRGYQASGVPIGGAMDNISLRLANILVGNDPGDTAIEFTNYGATLMIEEDSVIAYCGGGANLLINQSPAPFFRSIYVKAYSLLYLSPSVNGYRSYLAIRGGFKTNFDLGSSSTYVHAALGGTDGNFLTAGSCILTNNKNQLLPGFFAGIGNSSESEFLPSKWGISISLSAGLFQSTIRIIKGAEWEYFHGTESGKLIQNRFIVSEKSNRMGYRLKGVEIKSAVDKELVSSAVCAGTIQVTHQGEVVLLMADAQTTGGYPRIARVASVDIPRCAQLRPGSAIQFTEISAETAEELYLEREYELKILKRITDLQYFNSATN